MKIIYTVSTCDIWKSNSSMSLCIVTTSKRKLIRELKSMLENEEVETDEDDKLKLIFNSNINPDQFCSELNNIINYAYFEAWED